ncbi:anthocyanidin 3-O-glucosyltransferase 5-like [Corylus avellana]|uniref:anthocyanidin 3-O-glucosyltransferase 5-like n=1 Tax=Corylus avellana TaxID=13451 RepID=UPI001E20B96E|nr:anthocyanidin 3-O-glucosyltransferase 5-like [Corylus avellana]
MDISKPHAALLSSPGMGHLIPVVELGKRLVTHHNFTVTIFAVTSPMSPAESHVIQSSMSPKLFDIVQLPQVDISGLVDANAAVVTQLAVMMREARPTIRSAISAWNPRPTVLIVDLFGTESLPIADELDMPKYVYVASNAWFLALTIHVPFLDKVVEGEYVDLIDPLRLPGCKSVRPEDVVDPMLDRTNQQYFEYVRMGSEIAVSDGVLLNTWADLQPTTVAALRDEDLLGRFIKSPVYPIGPLTRTVSNLKGDLFDWLDKQPKESVIYMSFGSGGTLSYEQTIEIAWGLEMSQQRFIWVVRPPTIGAADSAFFAAGNASGDDDLLNYLPDGFLTRTENVGLVVPMWAPQVEVLRHPSVGGFVSHCGWNSSLESITNGVAMIAWPLYAEQRMNATLLTEELGVAVRPKVLPSKKVVGRQEIEKMVRTIMEDKEGYAIRARVKEIKHSAEKALSMGGSSFNALSELANQVEVRMKRQKEKVEAQRGPSNS